MIPKTETQFQDKAVSCVWPAPAIQSRLYRKPYSILDLATLVFGGFGIVAELYYNHLISVYVAL